MDDVLTKIGNIGLIPVVVINNAELAVSVAKALMDGGLKIMEITMRTEEGVKAIRKVKEAYPDILVGAGTVLSIEKAKECIDAGAEFIVSPGLSTELVEWCQNKKVIVTPGAVTPTEVQKALKLNLNVLKFFPCDIFGGIEGCKALYGPYRMVKFIPTGGINKENLGKFSIVPYIHAVGGSWLCKTSDIDNKEFYKITKNVKESIDILLGFELAHVGINTKSEKESLTVVKKFSDAFGFNIKEGNSSYFLNSGIEVNKCKGPGTLGHLAIKTNSIYRAVYYLGEKGYEVDWNTIKGTKERPIAVYLKDEIGGFAVHILQK